MAKARLDSLVWHDDLVSLNGVIFQLHEDFGSRPKLAPDRFWLFKGRPLLDAYLDLFRRHDDLDVQRIFELGIWETGSVAFWAQLFAPLKHIAVDLAPPREPALFRRYLKERGLETRVRTYWQTDQADAPRLLEIAGRELDGPLDLVIDDASHCLEPTKASLVTLFPLLRPGGFYVVEDWGWHLVPEVASAFPPAEPGLVPLVNDLLPLLRDEPALLAGFELQERLFSLERGPLPEAEARELLTRRLAPTYSSGPSLIRRAVRGSFAWQLLRRAVRGRR